jgi:hypothetical protein
MREIEANEDLVELNASPDNTVITPSPVSGSVNEEHDEELPGADLSRFGKKELIDYLKETAQEADFRKADALLKEVRHYFDELLDKDRSEALKRFIDSGGSPDDFEFRHDPLDISFEATYKLLKDRKNEYFKNLESDKANNFRLKTLLLEELRRLVDGDDDKHSFAKFKEIQQQWKAIGPVAQPHVRSLWASYHALMDRFYDNRSIYFELKELDQKKNLEAKLELCQRAEQLADIDRIGEAVRELNDLHEEYKHIGPVSREEKDAVWDRFKKASDSVYARRDAFLANLNQELRKNLEAKEQLIADITALATFQSDRIKDWNQKTAEVLALQKKWEAMGTVPRAKAKEINRRFWTAFKSFFNTKGIFFKGMHETRLQNLGLKKELVKQAEALKGNQEWDKTANGLKQLQVKWKEIGPVPDKYRDSIYREFKSACDFFFEQRRVQFEEADRQQSDNLVKKEALCSDLERMAEDKTGSLDKIWEYQRNFQSLGFVPRGAMPALKARFTAAIEKVMSSLGQVSQEDKDKMMLEMQLESLKSDPDAAHKIYVREQALRKRIQKAENDLAILKNNLEFFGRSKNADKMRAEFNGKIEESAKELVQLKSQLKLLKAAQ